MMILLGSLILFNAPGVVPTQASEEIKIGAILPLTGALLRQGPKVQEGAQMAFEDAGWQVAGKKIKLIVEDSGTNPTTGLDKARKLVESDKVIAIMGPQHSGVANAIQPYMNKNKVLSLKSRQFPKPLIAKYPYLIVLDGTQEQTCWPMGWYAYEQMGFRKITAMGSDFIAGRAFVGGFMKGFKEKGGEIVQEQWFPLGNVDFGPYLGALKPADACASWLGGPGALRFITQYYDYGVYKRMPLIAAYASSLIDEDILPQLGEKALGIVGPSSYASTLDNPINERAVKKYKAKHGVPPPDSMMVGGYMNAFVLLKGLEATRGDTNPDKLRKAILALKLKDTPIGPLSFTPQGAGIFNVYVVKVAKLGGEYVWDVVHTYPDTQPR
jgi:branched-chain amino acid transport system substrate-binding protein